MRSLTGVGIFAEVEQAGVYTGHVVPESAFPGPVLQGRLFVCLEMPRDTGSVSV
ncbi:MAG: hypothetical protein ACLRXA_22980 [Clostridium sp.]